MIKQRDDYFEFNYDDFPAIMSPTERSPSDWGSVTAPEVSSIEFDGTTVLCRVCGDKASGFHYGVHSCEGCKGFFRRSIQQKIQYRPCTKNQQCSILRVNRNRCQYCRLKKCIAVGMSRDAVRFGRVPKREKAKILAAMQSVNAKSQEKALTLELEDEAKLVASIVNAHLETCEFTKDKITPMLQRAREDPVYTQSTTLLACPLNPPVQAGSQRVSEDFSLRFAPVIQGVVEFAKRIPGFAHLSQDDQVTLLKAGLFEVLLVRLSCLFDSRTNTMMCLNGQVMKRESMQHTSNARFLMDSMFDFSERLNVLQMLDSEIALFSAVIVIAADRPGLRNVELVEKMQGMMMQALQNAIKRSHPQSQNVYQELMKKIPDLRTLNTLHSEKLLAYKMDPRAEHFMSTFTSEASASMHALYQTQVGHWNAYGLVGHKSPHHPSTNSDDSKGSWEDQDNQVNSPGQHVPLGQDSHRLIHGCADMSAWSPSDINKNQDIYGSNSRSPDDLNYRMDEVLVSSPSNSSKGSSSSILHMPIKDNEGGSSSGDEAICGATSPSSKCPFKRKLESPTDSGIDSGKDLGSSSGSSGSSGSQSPSASTCSSPSSSMDEKVKDITDCEILVKQETIEDMPVLKRALQAPPLINTNLLMDEAYKPHKKFRALRKDSDSDMASSPSSMSSSSVNCNSPLNISMSLASTHSTLVKTLSQGPRMSEQQLKRTDIIHNIIMRSEQSSRSGNSNLQTLIPPQIKQQDCEPVGYSVSMSSPNPSSPSPPYGSSSPMGGKGSLMVCSPGYYIPQPGATNHGNGYPTSVVSAASPSSQWSPSYVTRTTSPTRHSFVAAATSPSSHNGQPMSLNVVSSTLHHQQQHFSSPNLIQHSQNSQVPAGGNSTSPLPRMYYHPQGGNSSSPILATTPQSPSSIAVSAIKQAGLMNIGNGVSSGGGSPLVVSSAPSSVKSPTSPLAGQVMIEQQHYQSPQTVLNNRSTVDSQPLNLSKKLCSAPIRSHSHHTHISTSPHIHLHSAQERSVSPCLSQRVKLEVV